MLAKGVLEHYQNLNHLKKSQPSLNQKLREVPAREFNTKKTIKNIATLTGAGTFTPYLKEAKSQDIDLYITGETSLYLLEYAKFQNISVLIYSHNYTELFRYSVTGSIY